MAGEHGTPASLYERIGGHEPLVAVVDTFARRLIFDAELAHYFAHLDLDELRSHQVAFLDAALGGQHEGRRIRLRAHHQRLPIGDREVELVLEHLADALRICGVPADVCNDVLEQIAARRSDIVTLVP
jgi:hemoglobin